MREFNRLVLEFVSDQEAALSDALDRRASLTIKPPRLDSRYQSALRMTGRAQDGSSSADPLSASKSIFQRSRERDGTVDLHPEITHRFLVNTYLQAR